MDGGGRHTAFLLYRPGAQAVGCYREKGPAKLRGYGEYFSPRVFEFFFLRLTVRTRHLEGTNYVFMVGVCERYIQLPRTRSPGRVLGIVSSKPPSSKPAQRQLLQRRPQRPPQSYTREASFRRRVLYSVHLNKGRLTEW